MQAHRGLQYAWLSATPTTAVFSAGTSCVEVTRGGCSCELYMAPAEPERAEDPLARERQRLERKGWPAAKIARALEAKMASGLRPSRRPASAAQFNAFIAELVDTVGHVELFAHFYSGSQREPAVGCPAAAAISLKCFAETGFPPDTLVTVRATG